MQLMYIITKLKCEQEPFMNLHFSPFPGLVLSIPELKVDVWYQRVKNFPAVMMCKSKIIDCDSFTGLYHFCPSSKAAKPEI